MMANALYGWALQCDEPVCVSWRWLMENTEVYWMDNQPDYKWTVHCFTDKSLRKHFEHQTGKTGAVEYANQLLARGHRVKIYPYRKPRCYVDIVAERGPNG